MSDATHNPATTALVLVDMQNDFIHPDGAYRRGGVDVSRFQAIVPALARMAQAARSAGILTVSTHFTLVPGRGGAPIISDHLRALRPFLTRGDFKPGGWGHDLIEDLAPTDIAVEKVAYSAFFMSRLEWVLRKNGIAHLLVGGIVTNGGVASTVRQAHVLDFHVTVLADGCAAADDQVHRTNLDALTSVADIAMVDDVVRDVG